MIVTIGVIALLMSLMIPTVKNFQAEARSTVCMNNLRQLFASIDTYRVANKEQLPMCEFLPVVTDDGPEGGLPEILKSFLAKDSDLWRCPADFDEEGSLSTGTSYFYLPGLLRYSPPIQFAVQQAMIPYMLDFSMSQKMKDRMRLEAEARLTTKFYESSVDAFAIVSDSQDRHRYGDRNPKNGLYLDGSVRILEVKSVDSLD